MLEEALDSVMNTTNTERGSGKLPDRVRASTLKIAKSNLGRVELALETAKKASGDARQCWIERSGTDAMAQLSFLGRALPKGDTAKCKANLAEHALNLSSEHLTNPQLLDSARDWATRWGRKFLSKSKGTPSPGIPSLSSCVENSASRGGARGLVAGLGMHPYAEERMVSMMSSVPPQDAFSVAQDISMLAHGYDLLACKSGHKVVALPERGLKARVVTTPSAGYSLVGHVVRKRLLSGLRRDPASMSTLQGFKDDDVEHLFGASGDCVTSTDLKSASDLLPLDLVNAIIDGLGLSGKIPGWELDALRKLSEPQHLIYPDGTEFVSKRGILMGLPTTWALLSLIHLFWWSESVRRVAASRRISLRTAFSENRFMICGDDGLAAGWREVSEEYLRIVTASGGSSSPGKHFVVVAQKTPRAVFLERLYQFRLTDGLISGYQRNGAIPLRGLVRPDVPDSFRGSGVTVRMSEKVKLLFSVDAIFTSHPMGRSRLCAWLSHHTDLREFGIRLGLVDGLPLRDGGNGCPRLKLEYTEEMAERRWRAAYRRSSGESIPCLLRGLIDPVWQLSSTTAREDLGFYELNGVNVRVKPGQPEPEDDLERQALWVKSLPYGELVDVATEVAYVSMLMPMGAPDSKKPPVLHERRLKAALKEYFRVAIPVGTDLSVLPVADEEIVWIQRTRGPTGSLFFPPWAGEQLASEAATRTEEFAELARFARALA